MSFIYNNKIQSSVALILSARIGWGERGGLSIGQLHMMILAAEFMEISLMPIIITNNSTFYV